MKKHLFLSVMAFSLLALCLAGCSSGSSGARRTTTTSTAYEVPQVCHDAFMLETKTENPDLNRVLVMYTQCLEGNLSPKNRGTIHYNRGNVKYDLGDKADAIADYDMALAYRPDYDKAFYNRGNAKYDMGDMDAAVADYTSAIAVNPQHAKAYGNRAFAYKKLGRLEEAKADAKKAKELDPEVRVPTL